MKSKPTKMKQTKSRKKEMKSFYDFLYNSDWPAPPKPGSIAEIQIVVTITHPMWDSLNELVRSGLYGTDGSEAARRILERGLMDIDRTGMTL